MKTNKMMRVASVLLVAVLLTACAISGTFAKYTTNDGANDSAQVAKWGVQIAVGPKDAGDNGTAFARTYENAADEESVVAAAGTTYDLVAPGTKGTLLTTTISGAPEVLLDVKADVNVELENWTVDGAIYFPVVIKIGTTPVDVSAATSLEAIEAIIEDAIIDAILGTAGDAVASSRTERFEANTTFNTNVTVTWEWDFDDNGAGTNDELDTALGNADTKATISITSTVTATQVD